MTSEQKAINKHLKAAQTVKGCGTRLFHTREAERLMNAYQGEGFKAVSGAWVLPAFTPGR